MNPSARPRVMVTGLGAVSPLGLTWPETWKAMLEGRSGIGPIEAFDASAFRSRIAGQVCGFEPAKYIQEKTAERLERYAQFALAATREALAQAGLLEGGADPERVAVVVGTGIGGLGEVERQQVKLMERGPRALSPLGILKLIGNTACGQIGIEYGFQGPSVCTTSACASGAHALAFALDLIRAGRCDVAVCGGSESAITPLCLGEFCAMQALSLRNDAPQAASRPFDRARDGFVLAEGCGIAVLESEAHARSRGARPLAEFRGAGMSADAHHLACPHPAGRGFTQAMQGALRDAGLQAVDVGYLNAHGTSTKLCDELEASATRGVFGASCETLRMSSTKSMTGHLLGGAGGLEFAVIVQALLDQVCPPTLNLEAPAPECAGLNLVPGQAQKAVLRAALSNSFGFGGHNVSLVAACA